jgi:hypothetical protein
MTASDPILQRAVLIEAGENRYRGNAYTEQQAGQAVAAPRAMIGATDTLIEKWDPPKA